RFHPERLTEYERHVEGGYAGTDLRQSLAKVLLPSTTIPRRATFAQSTVDLALVALSLERHWLRYGAYPGTLKEIDANLLSIRGIPLDCVTARAPHYRLIPSGTYELYYEGWNACDDGGFIPPPEGGVTLPLTKGDWVWPQLAE
ncbi:MAG: hypothetical protein ACO1QR_14050, partial [Chthoniobacteraceae bacterium]